MNDYSFEGTEREAPLTQSSDGQRPPHHRHHHHEKKAEPRLGSFFSRHGLQYRRDPDTRRKHDRGHGMDKERDGPAVRRERAERTEQSDRGVKTDRTHRTARKESFPRTGKTSGSATKTKTVSSGTSSWPPCVPAYAITEGRRLVARMQHGRQPLEPWYIVTMRDTRNNCEGGGSGGGKKLLYQGRAADLLDDCADYLAYVRTETHVGLAKKAPPRSLFSRIEEWYDIPETQWWRLWGVHQTEDGKQAVALLVSSRSDVLHVLTDFCAGAATRGSLEDRWMLYFVVDVASEQPQLFDTIEVEVEVEEKKRHRNAEGSARRGEGDKKAVPPTQPRKPPPACATPDRPRRHDGAKEGAAGVTRRERAHPTDGLKAKVRSCCKNDEEPLIPQDRLNDDSVRRLAGTGTLLRQADTSSGGGDDVNDLDGLLPYATPPTDSQWSKCCRLLQLDPAQHQDGSARSIRIPGSVVWATPQQYWTAFRMLTWRARNGQSGGLGGGLLADAPGSGKTHTVLVFCLLRALVFHSRAAVRNSWAARDGRHRRDGGSDAATDAATDSCPCNNVHGVECFATPGSVTRRIFGAAGGDSLARGPALIQAGPTVIEDWKAALCAARLSTSYYHAVLFHTAAAATPRELARPDGLAAKMGCTATARKRRKAGEHRKQAREPPELSVEDCTFALSHDERVGHRPLERYIFLTTYEAGRFRAAFQIPVPSAEAGTRSKKSAGEGRTVYGCPVGLHIVDEFHRMRDVQSSAVHLALAHKHMHSSSSGSSDSRFAFWAVSGTPLPSGRLTDLAGLVAILQQPAWDRPDHAHHIRRAEALVALEHLRQRAASSSGALGDRDRDRDRFRSQARAFIGSGLVIRHAGRMPHVPPTRVSFATPVVHRAAVQVLADGARHRLAHISGTAAMPAAAVSLEGFRVLGLLQLLSSFPGAVRLVVGPESAHGDVGTLLLRACADPVEAAGLMLPAPGSTADVDVATVPLVAACWQTATRDSPKLDFVVRLLRDMDRDRDEADGRRTKKKLLLITPGLVDAVLFYVVLRQRQPDWHPALLHSHLSATAKADVLAGLKKTDSGSCRLLVAPFAVGGTGLNLQAANYQVLTAPLRRSADEEQCFGRTNRAGQQLPVHHYLLLSEDSPYDRLMVAAQTGRTLAGDAFDVGADVTVV